MSGIERSKGDDCGGNGGGGVGGSGRDDEDGEGGGVASEKDGPGREISRGYGEEGKRVSLFRFRKSKKVLRRRRKDRGVYVSSGCGWRTGRAFGCFLCLKPPRTLDSSGESPCSDPNSSGFTFDQLRSLIEKNDFYSKQCNPHLDGND